MYHLLKQHRRHLLAIATALLMVAFLLPLRNTGGNDFVIGEVYGKSLHASEVQRTNYFWNLLRQKIYVQSQMGLMPVGYELGQYAVQQIEEKSELFALLVAEAHKQGAYVSDEMLREKHQSLIFAPDLNMADPAVANNVNGALRDLLMVEQAFDRALSAIRVSAPMRDHEIATRMQQVKLAVVDFRAADFMNQVPQPTNDQLQQQFDKYKDVLPPAPGQSAKDNPFGFGYRFSDRAQLQYISLPTEEVRRVVEASKPADRWRVDARRHYLRYPNLYSSTTMPAGTTRPISTTRPFEEVSKEAVEAVVQPEVERQQAAIITRINQILSADWNAFKAAKDGKAETSLGVPFNSYEYIQKLSEQIQSQFKVRLTIGASGGLLGANELGQLGTIVQSSTAASVPFPLYATMTDAKRKSMLQSMPGLPQTPELWQPSQVLRDTDTNAYIFRRTAFEPEHSPKSLDEVRERVERDVKSIMAFEKAQQAADQFAATAREQGLVKAAEAAKKPVVDTGMISRDTGIAMGLHLSDSGTREFVGDAMDELLALRAGGQEQPIATLDVEKEGRVLVTRLDEVKGDWQADQLPMLTSFVELSVVQRMSQPMQEQWFSFANVSQRVQYEPAEG